MFHNKKDSRRGFTIIEVLIVLAIAGLIMLIVFLAVPALQLNSRNTQRKSDASHLSGLINEFVTNNSGKLPTGVASPGTSTSIDLTNENFAIMNKPASADIISGIATLGNLDTMKLNTSATCQSNAATAGGGARAYTVTYQVEGPNGAVVAQCI